MIKALRLKNYRNLEFLNDLELSSLNIFVGANGCGKSNVVKVLKFLQEALTVQSGSTSFNYALRGFGYGNISQFQVEKPCLVDIRIHLQIHQDYVHGYQLGLNVFDPNTVAINYEKLSRWSSTRTQPADP